ncbi:SRPBCC domain-containing protein [Agromyces sp. LHK192]|uniref:SRPBCC domain-containing protein n=1 Tax=Agromyces sp. LHK192 TaxID=2498704 RepID=UPI000FDC0C72|nr:SRPBCC domain-containing protein [Agromyces sp. LHK192]
MTQPHIYHVFIRAEAQAIWEAITRADRTAQYFYGVAIDTDADGRHSIGPDGSDWGVEQVVEFDPHRRLVHEWTSSYDPDLADEPASRVTWEIEPRDGGVCLVTLTHDRLEGSPRTAADVAGPGWSWVLSSMKSLIETGAALETA